ncbi:MAG: chorismate mutase [Deltaproteobacteria bacterium]|nr:chorismate mutase [Deltaproteobacteria bacterium]
MSEQELDQTVAPLREEIDRIDRKLLELLNERAHVVLEVGRIKHARNWPVADMRRENLIVNNLVQQNPGPLPPKAVEKIFRNMIEEMRSMEQEQNGMVQGKPNQKIT